MKRMKRASRMLWCAIVGAGCGSGDAATFPAPQVTVTTPVRRAVQTYADFTGTTRAVESAEIRARVSGTLEEIRFEPSRLVKRGEVLFVIERESYIASRDEALGMLRSAEAEKARAESDLQRVEQAIQTNAVSRSDLDRSRATRDQADAAVIAAQARLDNAQLSVDYTLVRSPIAGQVSRWLVDAGNLVGATEPTLLTTVNKMDPIYVYFEAAEGLVLALAQAQREEEQQAAASDTLQAGRVSVRLANEDDYQHDGVIDFIDNTVDPGTGTIELRAVLANPDTVLFPGLFVRIRVWGPIRDNRLVIQERAVGTDLGGKYVYIIADSNLVEQRYIQLGALQDDGSIVVEDGLDGDEQYIVNGMLRARPGLPVTPVTESEEG